MPQAGGGSGGAARQ